VCHRFDRHDGIRLRCFPVVVTLRLGIEADGKVKGEKGPGLRFSFPSSPIYDGGCRDGAEVLPFGRNRIRTGMDGRGLREGSVKRFLAAAGDIGSRGQVRGAKFTVAQSADPQPVTPLIIVLDTLRSRRRLMATSKNRRGANLALPKRRAVSLFNQRAEVRRSW